MSSNKENGSGSYRRKRLRDQIIRPKTPHENRMSAIPVCDLPEEGSVEGQMMKYQMERDIAFQIFIKELPRIRWEHARAIAFGGSGFQMSKLLRYFFAEYENRMVEYGLKYFPTSFNVLEAFFEFDRKLFQFQLCEEIDHLMSADDFFEWYQDQENLPEPNLLEQVLEDGVIYSFDMRTQEDEYKITGTRVRRIAGMSLVRHGDELSCLMLAGEKPPWLSDEEIEATLKQMEPGPGKEGLSLETDFSVKDRYLEGAPDYAKVVFLTRFNLRSKTHDVRYVLVDGGVKFTVLTDDMEVYDGFPVENAKQYYESHQKMLQEYESLFPVAMSLIYLPLFVADLGSEVNDISVSTKMQSELDERERQSAFAVVGEERVHLNRTVRCLPMKSVLRSSSREMSPPDFEFNSEGYWRPIGPTEIGEDQNGNRVAGRTWVSRHEQWTVKKAEDFVLEKSDVALDGPDPGIVYIQRSAGHAANVYKIGLTRRNVEQRAKQLSATTATPLPFDIIGSYEVSDCGGVEAEAHKRLARFRVNPRREYFRGELREIVEVLQQVVTDIGQ